MKTTREFFLCPFLPFCLFLRVFKSQNHASPAGPSKTIFPVTLQEAKATYYPHCEQSASHQVYTRFLNVPYPWIPPRGLSPGALIRVPSAGAKDPHAAQRGLRVPQGAGAECHGSRAEGELDWAPLCLACTETQLPRAKTASIRQVWDCTHTGLRKGLKMDLSHCSEHLICHWLMDHNYNNTLPSQSLKTPNIWNASPPMNIFGVFYVPNTGFTPYYFSKSSWRQLGSPAGMRICLCPSPVHCTGVSSAGDTTATDSGFTHFKHSKTFSWGSWQPSSKKQLSKCIIQYPSRPPPRCCYN